jgi:hypothetical protein
MRRNWKKIIILIIFIIIAFIGFKTYQNYNKNRNTNPNAVSNKNESPLPKTDALIGALYFKWQEDKNLARKEATDGGLKVENDRVFVTIIETDESVTKELISFINNEIGGRTEANYKTIIVAWVPIVSLAELSSQDEVIFIQNPKETFPLE